MAEIVEQDVFYYLVSLLFSSKKPFLKITRLMVK